MTQYPYTIGSLVREGAGRLAEACIDEAENDAFLLMEHVTGYDRTAYLLHRGEAAEERIAEEYRQLVEKRCRHIPLQHLTGVQMFAGIPIHVSENVLIPRPDTECLALTAREYLEERRLRKEHGTGRIRILDLCTGSGCVILALKAWFPEADCLGSDLSPEALAAAEENARLLGLDADFVRGDLLEPFDSSRDRFDLIVSNPPYIPTGEIPFLQPEVRLYDPACALDGGADGLDFYRRIAAAAGAFLLPGGRLMLEIGAAQREAVLALLEARGFSDLKIRRDLAGRDRVISAAV